MELEGLLTKPDRWSLKSSFVSLLIVAVLGLICQLPGWVSFMLVPLTILGYGITALVILAVALSCLFRKRPRRAASVLLMLVLPVLLWRPLNWVDDVAHLALTVGFGIGEYGSTPKLKADDFVAYDWSVGFAGASTFLVHDVTDKVTLPIARHTHPPNPDSFEEECAGKVQRLINRYYICNF